MKKSDVAIIVDAARAQLKEDFNMIFLNTLQTIGTLEIKERYGKDFRRIKRLQPRDSISCRFTVFRGDINLQEFRKKADAIRWATSYGEGARV